MHVVPSVWVGHIMGFKVRHVSRKYGAGHSLEGGKNF